MHDALNRFADASSLIAHLDERFANGDIERALGGFGLMLVQPLGTASDEDVRERVAATMTATLRDTDFLATLSASTFAVVLPQISDRSTAERVAEKLEGALQRALNKPSAKIVVSRFPADGGSRDALMTHAINALSALD